jgi:CBS domain-containing protein
MLAIHEIMTQWPITATPSTTIGEVMGEFDRHDFNAIPVVGAGGELVGIVTKLDVLRALQPAPAGELPTLSPVASQRVESIMRRGVVTVDPEDSVVIAADLLGATRFLSLPVVKRLHGSKGRLVGIVTRGDLIRGFRSEPVIVRASPQSESPWLES